LAGGALLEFMAHAIKSSDVSIPEVDWRRDLGDRAARRRRGILGFFRRGAPIVHPSTLRDE
jgi:hypothetical protein